MRDLFKSNNHSTMNTIKLVMRAFVIFLLVIIAYNTSFLRGIFQEMVRTNQEKQFVVNVNNAAPNLSAAPAPAPAQPSAKTTAPQSATSQMAAPQKVAAPKATPTKTTSEPSVPEPNPNPTTHKVEMLNNSPEGAMVFNPPYLQIKAGDSVEFLPASYGHNVQTPEEVIGSPDAIPKNAKPFKGAMNEKLIVKFTEPGIYLYICNYHYIVGHVGVIQVGNDSHNLDTVKRAGTVLKGKIFSHPDRIDKYLNMVKTY